MRPEVDLEQAEQIVRTGEAARRLLDEPAFVEVMNALSDYHLAAMVAAPVGKDYADVREHHHTMLHALKELHAEITGRAQALEQFEREQQDEDETE